MLQHSETISGLLSSLFADAPVGIVLLDTELRYVLVNDALAQLHGVPVEEHAGRRFDEVVPHLADQLGPVFERVLAGEHVADLEVEGGASTTLESFHPLRDDDGFVTGVGGVIVDVSNLRHVSDSERYLRELLHEERSALREVFARAPGGVALLTGDEHRIRMANDRFRELTGLDADPSGRPLSAVLPELWPALRPHLVGVRKTGIQLTREDVPVLHGRFATLTIRPISHDGVHHSLLLVLRETTTHVSERARLGRRLDDEQRVVGVLQRTLLPRSLPVIPGAQIAARYEAAGRRHKVGGDFYDAFAVSEDDSWVLVVGDVCGKGPEAAALTAMARHTLRTEAHHATGPAELLARLNQELLRHETDESGDVARFATVALVWLRTAPGGGHDARLASAGHPDTLLLRAGGRVERFAPSGPPCGTFATTEYHDDQAALGPGDALILYTDGVLDAGAPARPLDVPDLAGILEGNGSAGAERLTEVVFEVVARNGGNAPRDDYAVLAFSED